MTSKGAKKCLCRRGVVVARVWDDGWYGICARCRSERLVRLASEMSAALTHGDEAMARGHLYRFVELTDLPTKLTTSKLPRIYDMALAEGVITFKIDRHHELQRGAVQTWFIDVDSARVTFREEARS
jgi:hypothetical protein